MSDLARGCPRKRRARYMREAQAIAAAEGWRIGPDDWEAVWSLLDKSRAMAPVYAIVDVRGELVRFGRALDPHRVLLALEATHGCALMLQAWCQEDASLNVGSIQERMRPHLVGAGWVRLNEQSLELIGEMRRKSGARH